MFNNIHVDNKTIQMKSTTLNDIFSIKFCIISNVHFFSGFIPRSEHYFGKRYAETCKSAIADFEVDQKDYDSKLKDLKITEVMQQGKEVKGQDGKSMPVSRFYFTANVAWKFWNSGITTEVLYGYKCLQMDFFYT